MANEIKWSAQKTTTVAVGVFDVVVPFTFDGAFTKETEARLVAAFGKLAQRGGKLCPLYDGMSVALHELKTTGEGQGYFIARQMHD